MNRATLALLLAMLAWGTSVTVADAALADLSAADLLLLETLSGTAAVVLACRLTGRPVGGAWRPAFALGSLEPGLAYVFANLGLALTAAAVGSMLLALESVFVVLLAWLVLAQRPRRAETYALGLGVAGAVLVASRRSRRWRYVLRARRSLHGAVRGRRGRLRHRVPPGGRGARPDRPRGPAGSGLPGGDRALRAGLVGRLREPDPPGVAQHARPRRAHRPARLRAALHLVDAWPSPTCVPASRPCRSTSSPSSGCSAQPCSAAAFRTALSSSVGR